jgi:hypothetical protein
MVHFLKERYYLLVGYFSLVGEIVVHWQERLWFVGRRGFGSLVRQ